MTTRTSDFDYELPDSQIAQQPIEKRDDSRLLSINRASGALAHRTLRDLPTLLRPGDVLVVNDSKVLSARLAGRRPSGGKAEVFLLKRLEPGLWEALVRPARKLGPGAVVLVGDPPVEVKIVETRPAGLRIVGVDDDEAVMALGRPPLPPYIRRPLADPDRYQTVYARAPGSAAAPTAGLHFTSELLDRIKAAGVALAEVTLHVGLDTFRPVSEDDPRDHSIHSEWCAVSSNVAEQLNTARDQGGRIVAVGTTVVRALETAVDAGGRIQPFCGSTRLFILPGFRFRAVDVLLTNFHLPRSTLLMMVSAFAGRETVLRAYRTAIDEGYRFYSFGDAMLIV